MDNEVRKKWTTEENNSIKEYYPHRADIATRNKLFRILPDRSWNSIQVQASKIGIRALKVFSEHDGQFIKNNSNRLSHRQIANILGRTRHSVAHKIREFGLSKKTFKHHINDMFFDKPDIINSYFAGFIAADGNLGKTFKQVTVKIHKKDVDLLNSFKENLGYDGPIRNNCGDNKDQVAISFKNSRIYSDLIRKFNIMPNKSLTHQRPEIYGNNALYFIIGYIDGDGCIKYDNQKKVRGSIKLQISGTKNLLEWIRDIFDNLLESNSNNKYIYKDGSIFRLVISGHRAKKVIDILNSLPNRPFYMSRKWDRIFRVME